MCLDGNSAPASVRYLNSQLAALWKNAADCATHFGDKATVDLSSSSYKKSRYTRSLAQFHYADRHARGPIHKEYLLFSGSFGKPKLQFICNHETILHLNLQEGHLNTAISKAHSSSARVNIDDNVDFDNVHVAVRMKFARHNINSQDPLIGNGEHIIQLMVLDFESAQIVSHDSSIPRDVLNFYVHQYLHLLRSAGHHVFFDLPDFDNDDYSPLIDYSLSTTAEELDVYCGDIDIHGIDLTTINDLLRSSWLKAVAAAAGLSGPPPSDRLSTCLTEIKSIWLPGIQTHFHLKFNPPKVRAICAHEVVLYFNVDEVLFYESADFSHRAIENYSNWQIAMIVSTVEVRNEEGVVIGVNFDFNTARFCRQLSVIAETTEIAQFYFEKIVEFVALDYIELLVSYKLYQLHIHEVSIYEEETEVCYHGEEPSGGLVVHAGPIGEILVQTVLHGFDQIISVSEESINTMFLTLWKHARDTKTTRDDLLVEWSYESAFKGFFDAIKVELLSDRQAIVRINFAEGTMTLKGREDSASFSAWSVAFLVDIKMIEHREEGVSESWLTRYRDSVLGRKHTHKKVKHLILDFANATFLLDQSVLTGLWDSGISSAVATLHSIVHYTSIYLGQVAHNGYNIVYSVPLTIETKAGFGLTSIAFQVVSKTVVTIHNRHRVRVAPVILITGMCGHRSHPKTILGWSEAWVIRQSLGTVVLSRDTFLEGRLLSAFAGVNAKTTVLPRFPTVDEDEFSVYLSTLENHPYRKNKKTEWNLCKTPQAGYREYYYKHRDEWSYEHSDSHHDVGAYSVLCQTNNELRIPTVYYPGCMQITLRGESVLRVTGKDEHKSWSQQSTAKWSTHINIHSEWNGLRVDIAGPVNAEFGHPETTGNAVISAHDLLYKHLPKVVDIKEVLTELKNTLEGVWKYSFPGLLAYNLGNPVFTANGDLVLQLRPHDPYAKPPIQLSQTKKPNATKSTVSTTTTTTTTKNTTSLVATPPRLTKKRSIIGSIKGFFQDTGRIDEKDGDYLSVSPGATTVVNTPVHEVALSPKIGMPIMTTVVKPVETLVTAAAGVTIDIN